MLVSQAMPITCKAQKDEKEEMESSRGLLYSCSYFVTLGIWIDLMLKINSRSLICQENVGKECSEV